MTHWKNSLAVRGLSGSLVLAAMLLLARDSSAVLVVGDCKLPESQMARVMGGADDCPEKNHKNCSISEAEICADNACGTNEYNPYEDCYDACMEYHVDVLGVPEEIADLYCKNVACDGLPDEDVTNCGGALTTSLTILKPNGYDDVKAVASSNFESLTTTSDRCYRKCNCGKYCSLVGPPGHKYWECDTTSTCTDTGVISVIQNEDPGKCPRDRS